MEKRDYLADLRGHPGTTALESAARLDVASANVSEALRRARKQGLVRGDNARPEKFWLTDPGAERLRVLEGEKANSNSNADSPAQSNVQEQLATLEDTLGDVVEDVKVLFRFADKHLGERRNSVEAPIPDTSMEEELLEQNQELQEAKKKLEEELERRSRVLEFYALELTLAGGDVSRSLLKRYRDALVPRLEPDVADQVRSLIEVEKRLTDEWKAIFGSDDEKIWELEGEISDLRKKLGFAFERSSLVDSGE